MTHHRETIRLAIKTLVTGLATTGANVSTNRVRPWDDSELPAIDVAFDDESRDEEADEMPCIQGRRARFIIDGRVKLKDSLDEKLDLIAYEVEVAIAADPTLGGVVDQIEYSDTEMGIEDGAEMRTGLVRIGFDASYRVNPASPDVNVT